MSLCIHAILYSILVRTWIHTKITHLASSRQRPTYSAFCKILRLQWRTCDKTTYSNQIYLGHLEMQPVELRSSKRFKKIWKNLGSTPQFRSRHIIGYGNSVALKQLRDVCLLNDSKQYDLSTCLFYILNIKAFMWCSSCECFIVLCTLSDLTANKNRIYGLATPKVPLVKSNEKHMPIHLIDSRKAVALSLLRLIYLPTCSNRVTLWICSGEQQT